MTWFRCGMKKLDDAVLNSLIDRSITTITSNVATIGIYAFINCDHLISAHFPNATLVNSSAFSRCTSLSTIDMPNLASILSSAFYGCTFTSVTFPKLASIAQTSFSHCSLLNSVTLENSTMCTLANVNAFENTPFAADGTGGTIYVPSDLVSTYEADATWAALLALNANNSIQAITP